MTRARLDPAIVTRAIIHPMYPAISFHSVPFLPSIRRAIVCVVLLLVPLAGGCARYEYDIVRPADLAQHVGTKQWTTFTLDDLEYRLRSYDNRLVALIYNRSEQPVRLSGEESTAVDPRGESHPLRGRTILPGSHIKLILPPPRPRVRDYGPRFGFGMGVGISRRYRRDHFGYGTYDDLTDYGPRYYTVYDASDATYWAWPGEGNATIVLAYERGERGEAGETFEHEFVFRRVRM